MQIVHIANWCTSLAHTLCKGLIWNYKNCWAQALTFIWDSGSASMKLRMYQALFFLLIQDFVLNSEICTISLLSFGWWYTLMKNKHQVSLYLDLKKMASILQITFSNGFCLKEKYCLSVCLYVCLSVCLSVPVTPFPLCSHYGIIMKFSGVITNDRSGVYAKVQGQRSKVKVTEVKTQISCFGTITPVWFHIWRWNDAQSLMLFRSGALLIFKVIYQISRSHR